MRNLVSILFALYAATASVAGVERIFPLTIDGERYRLCFGYDIDECRGSPVLLMRNAEDVVYGSLAYDSKEKIYYIYSHGKSVAKSNGGLYLMDRSAIKPIDPDFTLPLRQLEENPAGMEVIKELVSASLLKYNQGHNNKGRIEAQHERPAGPVSP